VSLTINAKAKWLFWIGVFVALGIALALLLLKDAAAYYKSSPDVGSPPRAVRWRDAFVHPLRDPLWCATTVVALGTAFGALYAVYAGNPAWGADGLTDISGLVAGGFAAVGGHTIVTTLTPSS
jgi:hypothetical protein